MTSATSQAGLVDRWLNMQRIGIAAYGVMEYEPRLVQVARMHGFDSPECEHIDSALEQCQRILIASLPDNLSKSAEEENLLALPPTVLHRLNFMFAEMPDLGTYPSLLRSKEPVRNALATLYGFRQASEGGNRTNSSASPLQVSRMVSAHMLDSVISATQLIRLGESLCEFTAMKAAWIRIGEDSTSIARLNLLLKELRTPHLDTFARLRVINEIDGILRHVSYWPQIANILLSQTFCWPLLVGETGVAVSFPIALDLNFDGRDEVVLDHVLKDDLLHPVKVIIDRQYNSHDELVDPPVSSTSGVRLLDRWGDNLRHAVDAAKTLWLSEHGNYGKYALWRNAPDDFRWKVTNASISFDFQWANQMLNGIDTSVKDRSAETYFAMAVLSRILGRKNYLSSILTGLIGDRIIANGTRSQDYRVNAPHGIRQKLRYAFTANAFTKVALPYDPEVRETVRQMKEEYSNLQLLDNMPQDPSQHRAFMMAMGMAQTCEVAFGAHLSTLADIVQPQQWRKEHYVRCPEIPWAMHSRANDNAYASDSSISRQDKRVQRVLELLSKSKSGFLDLQEEQGIGPLVVASALNYINREARPLRRMSFPWITPPSLSWLFLRIAEHEQDDQFWETLYNAIGAPVQDFRQFTLTTNATQAGALLAKALNRFQPGEDRLAHRAHDIIVLIGSEHAKKSIEESNTPSARPRAIMKVLDEVASTGQLQRSFNAEYLKEHLGMTRIILMEDCPDQELDISAPEELLETLKPEHREILTALSTFRFGFTQSMAAAMHKAIGNDEGTREFLHRLCKKQVIRYGQGWYHIPTSLQTALQNKASQAALQNKALQRQIADYHLSAGTTLAPYSLTTGVSSLTYDVAFLPEHIHEASFHFTQTDSFLYKARERQIRILRFASIPSSSTTRGLANAHDADGARDGYEMAKEWLREICEGNSHSVHATHYMNVAMSGTNWYAQSDDDIRKELAEELAGPDGIFEQGLRSCQYLEHDERSFMLTMLMSNYANFLAELHRDDKERVSTLDQAVLGFIEAGVSPSSIPGRWFERVGDNVVDHSKALDIYKLGIEHSPKWPHTWIQALGATKLARMSHDWILDQLIEHGTTFRPSLTAEDTIIRILSTITAFVSTKGPLPQQNLNIVLGLNRSHRAMERWNGGVRLIKEVWHDSPKVQETVMILEAHIQRRLLRQEGIDNAVKEALIASVIRAEQGKSRSITSIIADMNIILRYKLSDSGYGGFGTARALFDQAVADGIIKYELPDVTSPKVYLADEEIPEFSEGGGDEEGGDWEEGDVKEALITSVTRAQLQNGQRGFTNIVGEMNLILGYKLSDRDYSDFGDSVTMFKHFISEGVIKVNIDLMRDTSAMEQSQYAVYLADEEIPHYDMGKNWRQAERKDGRWSPDASEYVKAARAGASLYKLLEHLRSIFPDPSSRLIVSIANGSVSYEDIKQGLEKDLLGPDGIFEQALQACEHLEHDERSFMLTTIMSSYANFLTELHRDDTERVSTLDQAVLGFIEAGVSPSSIPGRWFERVGDNVVDHSKALNIYKLGIEHSPKWPHTWIQALGATKLARMSHDWIIDQLDQLDDTLIADDQITQIIRRSQNNRPKAADLQHINERWNAGKQLIKEIWHDSAKVQDAIKRLPDYGSTLDDAVKEALIASVTRAEQGKPRTIISIITDMNIILGYKLNDRDYNGFGTARALFDKAVADGIIKRSVKLSGDVHWNMYAPTLYLADEEMPTQEVRVTLPIRRTS